MHQKDINVQIERIYGFYVPDSFFAFWDFANRASLETLKEYLRIIALGGPFDVIRAYAPDEHDPIRRARYYRDPPEFLTLMAGEIDGLHWGYYVDEAGEPDLPVASYWHSDSVGISMAGADLLEATRLELECHYRDAIEYLVSDASRAGAYQERLEKLEVLRGLLKQYATADRPEQGFDYLERYLTHSLRCPTIAPTRDDMGIVVPPESYRALVRYDNGEFGILDTLRAQPSPATDDLFVRNYFPTVAEAERMTDAALKALDAGFAGTALKLGKDLWTCGRNVQHCSYRLLEAAYDALRRPLLRRYLDIAIAHRAWCAAQWST